MTDPVSGAVAVKAMLSRRPSPLGLMTAPGSAGGVTAASSAGVVSTVS